MDNYYQILNIDSSLGTDEFKKELSKIQKKWISRQNAPDLRRRQEAERLLNIIQQAESILLDEVKRREYNEQLSNYEKHKPTYENSGDSSVEELIEEAWEFLRGNHYADAIVAAKEATMISENNANAWEILGYAHYMWNDFDKAIDAYRRAIDLAANNAEYYYDLCNIYLDAPDIDQEEKLKQAVELNRKALYLLPNASPYLLQNAVIDNHLENYDKALDTLENIISKEPDNQSCKYLLSVIYFEKAKTYLYFNEEDELSYIIDKENGETALSYFEKAKQYGEGQEDIDMEHITNWVGLAHHSLGKKFDFPGFKAFVIPLLVFLIGIGSSNVWLIIVPILFIGLICFTNYAPVWKINKVTLDQ